MSFADAFAPAEAHYKARVMAATWGHLAAKNDRQRYRASILFTCADYGGDIVIISAQIDGVADSPWLYDEMLELAMRKAKRGRVSRFEGVYYVQKNGRGRFVGSTKVMREVKP